MKSINQLKSLLLAGGEGAVARRAKKVGTTPAYLYKLALGHGVPSLRLTLALCKATPGLTPDDFFNARLERAKIGRVRPFRPRARKGS